MHREYFITTPLLLSPVQFKYGKCIIRLGGSEGRSFIEGPSIQMVDEAFDFICALQDCANLPGIRIHLRGNNEKKEFPKDPRVIKSDDWSDWAFNQIPLKSIPLIILNSYECEMIQKRIDEFDK